MILNKFNAFINKIENLARDPERFLTSKYQRYRNPNGFVSSFIQQENTIQFAANLNGLNSQILKQPE